MLPSTCDMARPCAFCSCTDPGRTSCRAPRHSGRNEPRGWTRGRRAGERAAGWSGGTHLGGVVLVAEAAVAGDDGTGAEGRSGELVDKAGRHHVRVSGGNGHEGEEGEGGLHGSGRVCGGVRVWRGACVAGRCGGVWVRQPRPHTLHHRHRHTGFRYCTR